MWAILSHFVIATVCIQLVCCDIANNNSESIDELVFVHIIYRHGDRNIVHGYHSDPWGSEKYWPGGYGELTNIGKQQTYQLGAYLRRRYHKLILNNGSYNRSNIYVRSTDVDRTLMSAAYAMAGMFPPTNEQVWNQSLKWQAIPIHTIPEKIDHVLAMKRPCPLYTRAYNEYVESDEIKSIFKENQELIQYLEKHTGESFPRIFDLKELYEILWIENLKNFKLPEWTKAVFPDGKLKELARLSFLMDTKTTLMKRLRVGFLIQDIFERLTNKENAMLGHSMWMYSAHDLTIVLLLDTLGLFESQEIPDYASCLFFELHKSNGTFHVEIIYKPHHGEEEGPLKPLYMPNCGRKCSLERLYELYGEIIPTDDFDTECQLNTSSGNLHISTIWLVMGLVTLLTFN